MDITIDVENYKLNVRAACIIIHNNKVLLHRDMKSDHYALLGGRIEIGEDSEKTIKREIQEELGKEIDIKGYISTVENFFEINNKKYHEYMFIYEADFKEEQDKKIVEPMENLEGKDYLKYEWIDLEKIDEYPLKPTVAKSILKERKYPIHKIHYDC